MLFANAAYRLFLSTCREDLRDAPMLELRRYHVVFVSDAMTDMNEDTHCHRVETMFPRLGEVETTEGVLKALRVTAG
jgi:isochorismate hydrolase